jgi:hypothetical protein
VPWSRCGAGRAYLAHAVVHRLLVALGDAFVVPFGPHEALRPEPRHCLVDHVRAHGVQPKANQHTDVVHDVDLARLQQQADLRPRESFIHHVCLPAWSGRRTPDAGGGGDAYYITLYLHARAVLQQGLVHGARRKGRGDGDAVR